MAVAGVVAVVCGKRRRRGGEGGIAERGVHYLIADEDARGGWGGGDGCAEGGEDLDAVGIGPVVSGVLEGGGQ